ncbi:MAG: hypothetical protein K2P70_10560 [Hyphomonadaceae bacterium]|nr:hypothetical protein [Hyphomonadaceae bacterium]
MNRAQRRAHARLWPLLVLLLVAVFAAALVAKTRIERAEIDAAAAQVGDE